MKKALGLLGLGAACAACCAVPLALPMFAAVFASSAGVAFGWEAAVLAALAAFAGIHFWRRNAQQAKAKACAPAAAGSCGCAPKSTEQS